VNRKIFATRWLGAISVVAISIAVAGCGGGSHSATNNSTSTTGGAPTSTTSVVNQSTTSTTSSTSPTGGRSYNLSANITTPQGYTFQVSSQATIGTPGTGDASQLPPGQVALVLPVAGTEVVRNTTPGGRDYSGDPGDGATLIALYKSPSPICPVPSQGPLDALYMDLNHAVYCIVDLVMFQDSTGNGIAAGQSVNLTPTPSTCQDLDNITGGCGQVPAPAADTSFVYLAANAQPAQSALAGPPDLVVLLGGSGSDIPSNACQPSDTLGWVIASSQPITSCS
jgi:hypothetical protein